MSSTTYELEPLEAMEYPAETLTAALACMALNGGNASKVSGILGINPRTLRYWRQKYPNRYRKACEDHAPQIEAAALHAQRELLLAATEGAIEGVYRTREDWESVKDKAGAARNLATVAGIAADKVLVFTGRPNHINENRTVDDDLRALRAAGIADPHDLTDADIVEDPPPALPSASRAKRASASSS